MLAVNVSVTSRAVYVRAGLLPRDCCHQPLCDQGKDENGVNAPFSVHSSQFSVPCSLFSGLYVPIPQSRLHKPLNPQQELPLGAKAPHSFAGVYGTSKLVP